MSDYTNALYQPIGFPVDHWQYARHPRGSRLPGKYCRLEPVDIERHGAELFDAFAQDLDNRNWTYLPYGPFDNQTEFTSWMTSSCLGEDPCFFAVIDQRSDKAVGLASFLRIVPKMGVIEVGHIHFSPSIQATPMSTEAMYLMMKLVFDDLGYRRYEWKCDALNAPSCAAARRLGFMFEGVFRQATMYKSRNRDTAWYSVLDSEWSVIRSVFEQWLAPGNFDSEGKQLNSLSVAMLEGLQSIR